MDKHTIHAGDSRTDFWAATFSTIEYPKLSCTSLPHYEFLEDNGLDVSMAEKYNMIYSGGGSKVTFYVPFIITVDYTENNINNGYELEKIYQGHSSFFVKTILGDGGILKQSSNPSSVGYSEIEIDVKYTVTSTFSFIFIPQTENSYIDGFIEDDQGNPHSFLIMTPIEGYNCIFNNTPGATSNVTCSSCKTGYNKVYNENKCLSPANKGNYFLSSVDNLYHKCDESCLTCETSSTNCLTCSDGYYPLYANSSRCLNEATKGENYLSNSKYYPCDSTCSSYKTTATNCLSCTRGYYPLFSDSSKCLNESSKESNYYLASDNKYRVLPLIQR